MGDRLASDAEGVIIKTCVATMAVVVMVFFGMALGPSAVLAHDRCHGDSEVSWDYYSYEHHEGHGGDDCQRPQLAPPNARNVHGTPASAMPNGAARAGLPTPNDASDVFAPAPPPVASAKPGRAPAAVRLGAADGGRVVASADRTGVSGLAVALGLLAMLGLLVLIRAGFRARRKLGAELDSMWPNA